MRLEIVIPTYNRPECIKEYMEHLEKFYGKYDFGVYVVDSSPNLATAMIIKKYKFVRYEKIDSSINVDEKTIYCLKKSIGEFVFLCGDGYALNVDRIFQTIKFDNSTDIYAIYDDRWSKKRTKYVYHLNKFFYNDKIQFFIDHFGMLTLYGGSIINKRLVEKINMEYVVKKYAGHNFIYPCTLAEYSNGKFEVAISNYLEIINKKKYPGWIVNKEAVRVWAESFCHSVDCLLGIVTKKDIRKIIKNNFKQNDFFSVKGLIWLRTTDNYSLRILIKYKKYLNRVLCCNRFFAFLIAIFPKKIFIKLRKIYQTIKGVEIK